MSERRRLVNNYRRKLVAVAVVVNRKKVLNELPNYRTQYFVGSMKFRRNERKSGKRKQIFIILWQSVPLHLK